MPVTVTLVTIEDVKAAMAESKCTLVKDEYGSRTFTETTSGFAPEYLAVGRYISVNRTNQENALMECYQKIMGPIGTIWLLYMGVTG